MSQWAKRNYHLIALPILPNPISPRIKSMRNMKKSILAIHAAVPATPLKPKKAAMRAIIKKMTAQVKHHFRHP